MNRIYLDNCATTPVAPEVLSAMCASLSESFGNPSSIHYEGQHAARVVADARALVAHSIGARPSELVFTASGTEANNLAIRGIISRAVRKRGKARVITSTMEHASIRTVLEWEKRQLGERLEIISVNVDQEGQLKYEELDGALSSDIALVAFLLVNNETGVCQDIEKLKQRKFAHPTVPWLLDAVQAQTKMLLDMRLLPFDMLSFCAHKIYGPKGIGLLYVRGGLELDSLIIGGSQEKYRRAGTENVSGIVGFAEAIRISPPVELIDRQLREIEFVFLDELRRQTVEFMVNGPREPGNSRLPGFLNLSFSGLSSREDIQIALDLEGVSLSSTSACHSGVVAESHVLAAMGIVGDSRAGAVRILFSRYHDAETAREVAMRIADVVRRMQDSTIS